MEVTVLRGAVAPSGSGSGDGYGSGSGDGYGSGYGSGDGSGSGDGYGSGYGSGDGDGEGYGSGDGSGDGYGSGYGSGDGYGDGEGYGSGYGYGDGYGSGYGSGYGYWEKALRYFLERLPIAAQHRAMDLAEAGARIAYWRSNANGSAANGGRNKPVAPGLIETEPGPLRDECGRGQLHATLKPEKWQGERWWIVALIGEVRGDDEKFWALQREVIGECLWSV